MLRRSLPAFAGLVIVVLLTLLRIGDSYPIQVAREIGFDFYQRLHPRPVADLPVRVIDIDEASLSELGQWPWPRDRLATIADRLGELGAAAIGFDILFPEPDRVRPDIFAALYPELSPAAGTEVRRLPPMDSLWGQVIGGAPVVLGRAGVAAGGADPAQLIIDAEVKGPMPPSLPGEPGVIANIPELEQAALGHGLLNGRPDGDGTVRRVPTLMAIGGRPMPSLSAELARVALDQSAIISAPGTITIGRQRIPVDAEGRMLLRFGHFPPARISSAADVLRKGFPADAFAGQIVLVGLAAEGTADIVATPLSAEYYGPIVQAQAVDAILRAGWLDRPGWVA
ncbi:MAG: CHASE2 domain-containing protein, partial [Acetobacteraceae bacterium]